MIKLQVNVRPYESELCSFEYRAEICFQVFFLVLTLALRADSRDSMQCDIHLVKQLSSHHHRCTANVSFGCYSSLSRPWVAWVAQGCRGVFEVTTASFHSYLTSELTDRNISFWPPAVDDVNGSALGEGEVALTFDDAGSGPGQATLHKRGRNSSTLTILDALDTIGVTAGFFVNAEVDSRLLRAMAERGHVVGSHADSHARRLPQAASEDAGLDMVLRGVEKVFNAVIGEPPVLIRAPFGEVDENVMRLLHARGYLHVGWNAIANDAELGRHHDSYDHGADKVLERWERMLHYERQRRRSATAPETARASGLLVLLHDSLWTAEALPRIAALSRALGFRLVPFGRALLADQLRWAERAAGCTATGVPLVGSAAASARQGTGRMNLSSHIRTSLEQGSASRRKPSRQPASPSKVPIFCRARGRRHRDSNATTDVEYSV